MNANFAKKTLILLFFLISSASQLLFSQTATVTIVASGGAAENTTWTYANNTISPNSSTAVSLNASDVLAKLALGDLTISGSSITINANILNSGNSNSITFKATGNITQNSTKTITTNGGDVIFWADSDGNSSGSITLDDNAIINTVNGSTASGLVGGGEIILAGGLDDGSNNGVASDGLPDGFATNSTGNGVKLGTTTSNYTQMYSGGGDIIIRGRSTRNTGTGADLINNVGLFQYGNWTANSGKGAITINGTAAGFYGINFVEPGSNTTAKYLSLISDKTSGDAINITGISSNNYGVVFNYDNPKEIVATGGGNITIKGTAGANVGIFLQNQDILASSGTILLDGGTLGIRTLPKGARFGSKTGSQITSSTANVVLTGDVITLDNLTSGFTTSVNTTGNLTIQPSGTSFSSAHTLPNVNLTLGSGITGLTIGKASNTSDITIGSTTTVAGPFNVYGGNITINGNINTSTGNANGDVLFKASGNIIQSASKTITTNVGDVTMWADSDASGTATSAGGSIYLNDASSINTSGGDIILAGGADTNTDGIPDGYAIGAVTTTTHGATNATAGLALDNASLDAGAGNLILRGHGTGDLQNFQIGTRLYGGSIKGADITIEAKGSIRGPSSSSMGLSLEGFSIIGTGNITINGWGGKAGQSNADANQVGVELRKAIDNTSKHSQIKTTGSGNITINGVGGSGAFAVTGTQATGIRIESGQINPIVSANGTISLNGTSGYSGRGPGINIGSPISSTDGNIILKANRSITGTLNQNGNIEINATVTTGGELNLESLGAVTQTAAITANKLALIGSGTFTLTNTSNNSAVIAGGDNTTKLGNISYVDASGGLTIGTVASKNGLTSTETISVESLSDDITISQNINTTNTTANAIVINAGKSTAIGTASGGDIKISGIPTITTGTGGTAKLFSGTDAGSTGLTTLVGGSSNTRTGVDETTSTFTPVLSSGLYALYRAATQIVAPQITSFTPEIAGNGETVTITGTGFTGVSVVKFGTINAKSFVVVSDTEITAVVDNGASGSVYVQNTAGNNSKTGFAFKVVHYQFENNTLDKTDANLDATIVGTSSYGTGASGNSICFTNNNTYTGQTVQNYLKLPNDLIKGRGANFTISLRFKTNAFGGILGYQKEAVGNVTQYVPILYVRTDGKLSANLWQGTPLTVTSNNRVDDGNWHKVEFSASSGSITVYLDGVLAGTSNGTADHLQMSFNQLGAANTAGTWDGNPIEGWIGFNGCIDEFFIVDKSLTANQIQQATQLPQPTISSFTPTTAKSGETITITGTNLSGTSAVKIGGVDVRSYTVVSATEIKAIIGKNASLNSTVVVTTAAGTVSSNGFTFSCSSNAFAFDGIDDYVQVGAPLPIGPTEDFTIEAWVKPSVINSSYQGFFGVENAGVVLSRSPSMWVGPNGSFHIDANNQVSRFDLLVNNFFTANQWTHLAWVKSGSTFIIYKNGVQVATRVAASSLNIPNLNFWIGKVDNYLNGSIDEVRIWNIARTAQQISDNYTVELVGNETGLKAYYNFNQGTAGGSNATQTVVNNLTSTANLNGTVTSAALSSNTSNYVLGYWPLIMTQPTATLTLCKNASTGNVLSVSAVGNQLTYQWYSNTTNSTTGGTAINNATSASFSVPTTSTGTIYYYVIVSNTCNASTVTSNVSAVTINSAATISYPNNTYSFAQGTAINAILPNATNATGFIISPSVPAGLNFNTTTGEISGTPTSSNAATNYTITATGTCPATTTLSISVTNAACNNYTAADFQTNGNAIIANGIYTLTLNQGQQNGSVWNKSKLLLDQNFDISAKVYLGNNNAGADGIAFVLQNQSLNAGSSGGGLGYAGITPSFAVEFDTYNNGSIEPTADHIALIANGATAGAHNIYSTPFQVEMEDGQWHNVRFVWNATSKNFQVWYEGVKRHDVNIDLKANIFNNQSYVYWGFTGATGGAMNLQQVELPEYCYVKQVSVDKLAGTDNASASTTMCNGATLKLKANTSSSYQWYKNGVAIANETSQELEVSTSGSYTVEALSTLGNTTTSEAIVVTVNALPAISYSTTPLRFERTKAITSVTPTSTGAPANNYTVSPSLPQGLQINVNTGVISGTPSSVSAPASYAVTARTASGCTNTTSFSIEVFNAVAPSTMTFSPQTQTVRQGVPISNMVPSASGDPVASYSISPALPAGLSINPATGVISGTLTASQTGSVTYTITATNSGGSTTSTITLVYNTAPSDISLTPSSVDENKVSGTTVGTLAAIDADANDTHTFSLVSGSGSADNASFTIAGNLLKTATVVDFETKSSYSIRVKVTDAGGLSFEKVFTITINDDDNEDTDGDGVPDFQEKADGTDFNDATKFKDTDGDGVPDYVELQDGKDPNDAKSYKDTDGDKVPDYVEIKDGTNPNDGSRFKDSDGGGVPDYVETKLYPLYNVPATDPNNQADDNVDSDGDGVSDYAEIKAGTNPNDAPANLRFTPSTLTAQKGTAITAVVPGFEKGKPLSYSISPTLPAGLTFNATTGVISGTPTVLLIPAVTYTITATNNGGSTTTTFTLGVNDVPPSALKLTPATQLSEQGKAIATMTPSSNGGPVVSYSIAPALPAGLTFNTTTGVISGTRTQALTGTVSYTITATNSGGSTTSAVTFTYNTTPTDIAISKANIYEGNAIGDIIGALSTTDLDNPETFTYTIVAAGTNFYDNKNFKISGNRLIADTTFNFDFKNSYQVRVRSTDSQGLFTEKLFTISISKRPVIYGTSSSAYITSTFTGTSNISTTPVISKGYSSQLSIFGSEIASVSWSTGTGLTSTTSLTPTFKNSTSVTYNVTITNIYGSTVVLPFTVEVRDDYFLKPSNILTTRQDGINDYFVVENIQNYPDNEVTIFDRNGKILTKLTNYNNRWDGKINGNYLSNDTYYYIIRFTSNPKVVVKGFITLINN